MNTELELIATHLKEAQIPEDVFGGAADSIKQSYHALAKKVHPDLFVEDADKILAHSAFAQLLEWFRQAEEKALFGIYGRRAQQVMLETRQHTYCIDDAPTPDGIFNVYPCRFDEGGRLNLATLKLVRDPHQNGLAQNELAALCALANAPEADKFSAYFPNLVESFLYQDAGGEHQTSVFERTPGWYSLKDVRRVYPCGVDAKDMAWMFRRLLTALGFAHRSGVFHGAVTPQNVWILPEDHGLMLTGWECSVSHPADPGADILAAVQSMLFVSGGDAQLLPKPIQLFFRGSSLPGKRAPQDAWALMKEFDELIARLWGRRTFRQFLMK